MRRIATLSLVTAILLAGVVIVSAKTSDSIPDERFYSPKAVDPLPDRSVEFLQQRHPDGQADVWVFFTDKGFTDAETFQRAQVVYSDMFTERAEKRREKHGVKEIRFADLPVSASYVNLLVSMGANIHETSRWLNAAAVQIDIERLDFVANQPFVRRIQPTAKYQRVEPEVKKEDIQQQERESQEARSLSYGSSATQLSQINVPICHDSGYAGQGIMIAVFDTGFRTSHSAFVDIMADGRYHGGYDFVFDDPEVNNETGEFSAWNHGTSTWSTCGGEQPGTLYGPAYEADFIVAKTEDVTGETQVEEFNWVAALEWVDSMGADIVTSSLSYSDWYVSSNYNGDYCVTTVAADQAAENGMLICNSAGNSGPTSPSIGAPADADSIITVGAVYSSGTLASFSSRGPTADGRTKPEVCAMGVSVTVASASGDLSYSTSSGTSFSCPLTAGAAAIVWGANPSWTNMQVREAMMMTADNADSPDNNYGWGIVDTWAALNYSYAPPYTPGDANGDDNVSISDVVYIINFIFGGGPIPVPMQAADVDCSSDVTITDAVAIINYIFGGGPAPGICS